MKFLIVNFFRDATLLAEPTQVLTLRQRNQNCSIWHLKLWVSPVWPYSSTLLVLFIHTALFVPWIKVSISTNDVILSFAFQFQLYKSGFYYPIPQDLIRLKATPTISKGAMTFIRRTVSWIIWCRTTLRKMIFFRMTFSRMTTRVMTVTQ
jgi:hypothetical protein